MNSGVEGTASPTVGDWGLVANGVACSIVVYKNIYMYKIQPKEGEEMFIKSVKVKKPSAVIAGIIVLIIATITAVAVIAHKLGASPMYELKTEAARQQFLSEMGWQVSEKYDECKVIVIPEQFNDVYNNYNKLQKEQGFNLEKYKGKTVEIYTYTVYNYTGYEDKDCVKCNLLICDGMLIGGDVCSTELGGFMQGLRK